MATDLELNPKHKNKSAFDVEPFRLEYDQYARICLLKGKVIADVAHYIQTMRDGKESGQSVICLGGMEAYTESGGDPEACPACKASNDNPDGPVARAKRRFVLPVGRYGTTKKGKLIEPHNLTLQIWTFGEDKFSSLADINEESSVDLRQRDLLIHCTAAQYQKYDITPSDRWMVEVDKSGSLKEQYAKIKEQIPNNLENRIGVHMSKSKMEELIMGAGTTEDDEDPFDEEDATEALNEVLEEFSSSEDSDEDDESEDGDFDLDSLLNDD